MPRSNSPTTPSFAALSWRHTEEDKEIRPLPLSVMTSISSLISSELALNSTSAKSRRELLPYCDSY